jgi:LysM repeat protein
VDTTEKRPPAAPEPGVPARPRRRGSSPRFTAPEGSSSVQGDSTRPCPFLIADSGDWRATSPRKEHRCAAFLPAASLAPEKQRRLCLSGEHEACATYAAAVRAREARAGTSAMPARAGRWGFARTAALVEDAGGRRAAFATVAADRRTWQLIPALVLVMAFVALGLSQFRGEGPVAAISSDHPSAAATIAPTISVAPTIPGGSAMPSVLPTAPVSPFPTDVPPTAVPTTVASPRPSARTTYTVKSGDTLYDIARKFGTTVAAIKELNDISDASRLHVGQVLLIP